MKKILTIILVLTTLVSFSQSRLKVYAVKSGPYNFNIREFVTEYKSADMEIVLENSVIYVSDNAHSVYITSNHNMEENDSDAYISSWDAVDEKSRKCKIFIGQNRKTGENSMIVMYNDYMFQYFYY